MEWLDAGLDKYDCGFKKATRVATAPPSTRKRTKRPARGGTPGCNQNKQPNVILQQNILFQRKKGVILQVKIIIQK